MKNKKICIICKKRKEVIRTLNKMDSYSKEKSKTNSMNIQCPRRIIEKGMIELHEEKELCPKCKSSIKDVASKYDWKNKKWIKHMHVCSDAQRCGWKSEEYDGDFTDIDLETKPQEALELAGEQNE